MLSASTFLSSSELGCVSSQRVGLLRCSGTKNLPSEDECVPLYSFYCQQQNFQPVKKTIMRKLAFYICRHS